jgi:hypothetical protein
MGARWKIKSGFEEIKQEIGSSKSQTWNPYAVINHLNFCMMAATVTWIYADHLDHAPSVVTLSAIESTSLFPM